MRVAIFRVLTIKTQIHYNFQSRKRNEINEEKQAINPGKGKKGEKAYDKAKISTKNKVDHLKYTQVYPI